jgi:DNA-binding MarR family transcriptional regulator
LAKHVELALAEAGLSLSQFRVLGVLSEGSAFSAAMAERLVVRPPSVSAMVEGLVSRGLIERHDDDDDRRRIALELTEEGRNVLAEAEQAVEARLRDLAANLGDEADQALDDLRLWQQALLINRQRNKAAR